MRAVLAALIAALALAAGAHAHPGGLNSEGCHNDRKNGGYHCHRATGRAPARSSAPQRAAPDGDRAVYYPNCATAHPAGVAPIRRGSPGKAAHLDRDNDGIACD